MANPLQQIRAT